MMMYEIVLCAFSQWSRFKNKNAITLHYVQCAFRSDQIDWRAIQEIFFVFFFLLRFLLIPFSFVFVRAEWMSRPYVSTLCRRTFPICIWKKYK